jgi:hypothetical protein
LGLRVGFGALSNWPIEMVIIRKDFLLALLESPRSPRKLVRGVVLERWRAGVRLRGREK